MAFGPIKYEQFLNHLSYETLTGSTITSQSGPGSNDNEGY